MRSAIGLGILVVLATFDPARAATIHVPGDYPTIQGALAVAEYGDTVLVAPGTYCEILAMPDGVVLVSESGPEVTFLDGSSAGTVITVYSCDQNTAVIGFTIQHGSAPPPGCLGGGMYISGSAVRVVDNVFSSNQATSGGGIFVEFGDEAEIAGNVFVYNHAWSGGGIYVQGADTAPWIHGNTFKYNSVEHGGGAICHRAGPAPWKTEAIANVEDNTIEQNQACWGGGVYLHGEWSRLHIHGNTIRGNHGAEHGGGICSFLGTPIAWGNTIANNTTDGCGGAICLLECESAVFEDNLIQDNVGGVCGGGLYAEYSSGIKLQGNTLERNAAKATHGGAIYFYNCAAVIEWNLFAHNACVQRGGGIVWVVWCGIELRHNTFVANSAAEGGGIYAGDAYLAAIENNIIVDSQGGYGVYLPPGGTAAVMCNDIWNNLPDNYYNLGPGPGDFSVSGRIKTGQCGSVQNQPFMRATFSPYHSSFLGYKPCF